MKIRPALLAVALVLGFNSMADAFYLNPNGTFATRLDAFYAPYPTLHANVVASYNSLNKYYTNAYNNYVVLLATQYFGTQSSPNYPAAVAYAVKVFQAYPPSKTVVGPGGFCSPGSPYAPFIILGASYNAGGKFYFN